MILKHHKSLSYHTIYYAINFYIQSIPSPVSVLNRCYSVDILISTLLAYLHNFIFSGHALLVLNIIECHSPKREELYICASSAVYLSSVFGGYTEAGMQMGGPLKR